MTADLSKNARGAYGERLVARWYTEHGYEVLARNWRCREGELDLVLQRAEVIVFCEVKSRAAAGYGVAEAVTWRKQRRIRQLALRFLTETGAHVDDLRFDVATVLGRDVEVIEGAF